MGFDQHESFNLASSRYNSELSKGLVIKEILDHKNDIIGDQKWYLFIHRKEREDIEINDKGYDEIKYASIVLTCTAVPIKYVHDSKTVDVTFKGYCYPKKNEVSLTGGSVRVNGQVQQLRIGTYLLNQIVEWSKRWPEAVVDTINISDVDARTETEKTVRNRLYEQFGIPFDFGSESKTYGKSYPIKTSELNTVDRWKLNIEEYSYFDLIEKLAKQAHDNKKDSEYFEKGVKSQQEILKRFYDNPFKCFAQTIWKKHACMITVVSLVIASLASVYIGFRG